MNKFISIKTKILVFALGIVLIITLSVYISLSHFFKKQIDNNLEKNLNEEISVFNEFEKFRTKILFSNAKILANDPDLVRTLAIVDNPELKSELTPESFLITVHETILNEAQEINKKIKTDKILITDRNGILLVDINNENKFGTSILHLPFVSEPLTGKEKQGIYLIDGNLYNLIAIPIFFGKYSDIIGVVILGFKIDDALVREIKKITFVEISYFIDKNIYASTLNDEEVKSKLAFVMSYEVNKLTHETMVSGSSEIFNFSNGNENFLSLILPIKDFFSSNNGFIILQKSKKEGEKFIDKINTLLLIITVLAILFSIIIGVIITNGMVRPIKILLTNTQLISDGNLETKIEIKTHDEIENLAHSFDKMRIHLKENIYYLKEAKNTLEERVVERTKEIEKAKNELLNQNKIIKENQELLLKTTRLASIGEMSGRASHEILNPVTSIYGRVEKLLATIQSDTNNSNLVILTEIAQGWNDEYRKGGLEGLMKSLSEIIDPSTGTKLVDDDLNNILGIAEDYGNLEKKRKDDLVFINKELQRITHIVDQMRILSRQKSIRKKINIKQVLSESLLILEDALKKRHIEIREDYFSEPLYTIADENELIQSFTNIIRNGMEAIETNHHQPEKFIFVQTFANKDKIEIRIQDSGTGIKEDHLPFIFESNFTTKSPEQGTGLGLGIARRFIRGNDGEIEVEKTILGKGTIFLIQFPSVAY